MGKHCVRVMPSDEAAFLAPLPVSVLDSINGKIGRRLSDLGMLTIGQLAQVSERSLIRQFGPVGGLIKRQSLGIDFSPLRRHILLILL